MKKKLQNLIILGGNSRKNVSWLNEMYKKYTTDYNVTPFFYDHWIKDTDIDFDFEQLRLKAISQDMSDYVVIAKSAGSLLSFMAINNNILKPKLLIVMGLPLMYADYYKIDSDELLEKTSKKVDVSIIQQKRDPQATPEEVIARSPEKTVVIPIKGNDHAYTEYKDIKRHIDKIIQKKYK